MDVIVCSVFFSLILIFLLASNSKNKTSNIHKIRRADVIKLVEWQQHRIFISHSPLHFSVTKIECDILIVIHTTTTANNNNNNNNKRPSEKNRLNKFPPK